MVNRSRLVRRIVKHRQMFRRIVKHRFRRLVKHRQMSDRPGRGCGTSLRAPPQRRPRRTGDVPKRAPQRRPLVRLLWAVSLQMLPSLHSQPTRVFPLFAMSCPPRSTIAARPPRTNEVAGPLPSFRLSQRELSRTATEESGHQHCLQCVCVFITGESESQNKEKQIWSYEERR